ncbi:septation protein A [Oceanibacterium hippocampi]|uniref:Inner membrane-spanning protein YciB n=1 Tax=Oceanibacterium hippocampi TaxID=745714 RepID=A0A1Y5REA7_9PROT|nr:septation protein A [Oceanibacterium hippocampi]SLN14615.1 putative intracellular septation protein A [Oceanibacterium hippocampi]
MVVRVGVGGCLAYLSAMNEIRKPLIKMAIEIGPLVVFFIANAKVGIFYATGTFMVAIVISLAASYAMERKLPTVPLVTAVFVLVMGGLTLYLHDELFIKLKPTVVNGLFAAILFGGLAFGKSLLRPVFGQVLFLTDRGWMLLTLRWALFFVLLAIVNEIVWRNFSTDTWVSFKVFGIMPLTLVFSMAQLPLLNRYRPAEEAS